MRIAILGQNNLGFIDGTCKRENYGTNLVDLWEHCNAIVLSWLRNCVSPELLSRMVYLSNANEVWDDLKERFDKVDCSRIFQIHREIATARQGTKFDSLAPISSRDAANSREFVQFMERQKLLQFLMGLNESYEQTRNQLLMMVPVPSVNKAYSILMERESQRTMSNTFTTVDGGKMAALMTNSFGNQQRPKKNYNLQCDECHMKGHTKETCYKVVGYPKDNKFRKKYNSQATTNFAAEDVPATTTASIPMVLTFTPEQYEQILQLLKGKETEDLYTGKVLGIGNNANGLYILKDCICRRKITTPTVHTTTMPTSMSVSQDSIKLEIWHQRLGHLPMEIIKSIDKFKNLHISNRSSDCAMCPVCPLARQTRLPFPASTSRAKAPFDLLYADVWDLSDTQFDCSVKILRTNNGSEFVNSNMKQLVETLVRKSQRTTGPPRWMHDYVTSSCAYPMSNYLSYDGLSPSYAKCLTAQIVIVEPKHYYEAAKDAKWVNVMRFKLWKTTRPGI
ncbi:uncharacterized protein LOC107805001 [Nicotiana tabacum]|uniref:Uncharacterized protein LOC107805001 n=1 Tax=Nicotiana tabacum TaxID=4097 RepID=A0A1S4B6H0_TOBAC|nr:PREDICTED: uncharacterized protein LOC107805001 [Nicotiana tabacum]